MVNGGSALVVVCDDDYDKFRSEIRKLLCKPGKIQWKGNNLIIPCNRHDSKKFDSNNNNNNESWMFSFGVKG